ncbi:MAG TPA: RIP metalloprotease RseP [Polyangiaceae bacterium]|nr:RIP metalloprotease RseP [Polyangiaceae bacterium]
MGPLYFVILVSSLIFVHELGHFLFAKAFGVKVLTFSLGFGPKILRLRGRETEYCISLLPLGGYVKMLEESTSDVVLPEDRKRTFESLPAYKRVVIVLAGPLMNLIFPVLLYFAVFVGDGPVLPPTIGIVWPKHAADGKLKPGDRVMAANGEEIGTFDELKRIIAKSPGQLLRLKVFRDNRHIDVEVMVEEVSRRKGKELDIFERVGSIGIESSAPAAVIGVPSSESPAYRAGLRTFDVITNVGGQPVRRFMDLEVALDEDAGETLPVTYLRPVPVPDALGGLADMAVFEAGVVALTPDVNGSTLLERTGIELADLYLAIVPKDSYLHKTDIRPGDKILTLDGEPVPAWSTFVERVMASPDKPHEVVYQSARDGRSKTGSFQMRREDFIDDSGQRVTNYVWNNQHWIPVAPEELVSHPSPLRYALTKAVEETVEVTRFTLVGIVRLIQGRISLKSLSGPITIYQIAGEEGRKGTDFFIWAMALISINLGLFNLLPIPVLDGGHLLFLTIEGVLRRPLPLRVREISYVLGMFILLSLMVLAFKNDLEKRWDAGSESQRLK